MSEGWIVVRNWERFQHPDAARSTVPPWIKLHTALLSDEAYLALSPTRRSLLSGIWLEYARTRRELPEDTATLSRRLAQRVLRRDLEALNDAGFIAFSASKPARIPASNPAGLEERRGEGPLTPRSREGNLDEPKTLVCRRCGAPIAPRTSCEECGATPRIAGSNARELAKPPKRSAYERAEAFTRNAGWQLERLGFLEELALFDLDDDQVEALEELRSSLDNGRVRE